ncbi:subtilase family protein [Bradyrhizobium huanghuaihaiense]|uniref:Subtilase family protein n=1 Tax=Bradyrhizobium huanghuaihaiense TaxID=990078 RepID=A0A562RZ62_9BRAD|nr:S8 family peptidase [Bradyrhizobium huanghuaihaiense]TWI73606.1 subtilase family protein [Bradyrhizobium huanghuaihaiense]
MAGADEEDYGARDRPHISINAFREATQYEYPSRRQERRPLREDYAAHANALLNQLTHALGGLPAPPADTRLQIEGLKPGTVIEISTRPPEDGSRTKAAKVPAALDFPTQDIVVLRTERRDDRTESALVFVPDDARTFLQGRITNYGSDPGNARRPDLDRFEVVETIASVSVRSLFVGDVDFTVPDVVWWEFWVRNGPSWADRVAERARAAELDVHADRLFFPDTTVVFVHGAASVIAAFASRVPGAINEIRRALGTIEPFLDRSGPGLDQHDWVAELAQRVVRAPDDKSVVCALDTGVAADHLLIVPGLKGAWAYDAAWQTDDHAPDGGHGTGIASLILYGDLEPHMNGAQPVELTHGVESMKLLPPKGFPPTKPPSYGVVTQGAVAQVEIERPGVIRSFCLANSAIDFSSSRPSTWSGALDQVAAGSMPGDAAQGLPASAAPKRFIIVAAGNVAGGMLADVVPSQPLEDPSQSWNALTIGGITRKDQIPAPPPALEPVVPANHRSPFSRGSQSLPDDLTPIKPEVLFEAGNMLSDNSGFCGWHPAVSLLAAGSDVVVEPLVPFWATSAAAGVAGNFVGQLQAALMELWPETHRALAIDSATWPQPIRKKLIGTGAHWKTTNSKADRQKILREVGYGVPDIGRAILSARNDVTLVAEAEIQPYAVGKDGRTGVFNEMHFYDLPWPRAALEQLENEIVTMKVTLSYFIEPNLTGRAATRPDTYRSFGLRFAMKKRTETDAAFRARINAAQDRDGTTADKEADCWLLGPKAVQAGSLHCDLWRGHAVDLAGHDAVAVYPVGGWWKSHLGQQRVTDKGRYALVISIAAPEHAIDLYTEIENAVQLKADVEIPAG